LDVFLLPPARPAPARFITSLVLAEESDLDPEGTAASHFELYLQGMEEIGASTTEVLRFLSTLREGKGLEASLVTSAPPAAHTFVSQTLSMVEQGTTVEVLSSLLFAREDLIPEMFSRLVWQWTESHRAPRFVCYLERHIELDGDEHRPAAVRALAEAAGDDERAWEVARRAPSRRSPRASPCGRAFTPS
jgi:hypothetical protein